MWIGRSLTWAGTRDGHEWFFERKLERATEKIEDVEESSVAPERGESAFVDRLATQLD
jgi:hypothetical protein